MSERKSCAATSMSRRKFIQISAAAPAASVVPSTIGMLLASSEAKAQAALGEPGFATLVKMARDIYPHDKFEDTLYRAAVAGYGDQMGKDEALKKLLTDGIAALNTEAQKQGRKAYAEIAGEPDRVKVLKAINTSPFFKKIRGDLVVSLYNQPAVWAKLGYQGPSFDQGGYLKRGFNDQNWMNKA
ncbi:MAG: gluconate 2-dehydrogenase subunit 3 family protein [Burkholderiales bacterium]|nr:gluconate 2-dehydrogenase subunit 3 family protein [Burkholderiales bacterium]